jgi:ankyrin repeat protein
MSWTLLHEAALLGDNYKARCLLSQSKSDLNSVGGLMEDTPLHCACRYGHMDMVRILISEFEADTTIRNWQGRTPLHVAASEREERVALALITEFCCDINTVDRWGISLLHKACEKHCLTLVRTLLSRNSYGINIQDRDGDTALHLAILRGQEDVALILITEFHCNTNVKGRYGRTPLHYACIGSCLTLIRKLIRDGKANINAQDVHGNTPLHLAAQDGNKDVALILVAEFRCDIRIMNKAGDTALHCACCSNYPGIVKIIGEHTSPLVADRNGNTPLHVAVAKGNLECVEEVLKFDIHIMTRNNEGKTAMELEQNQDIKTFIDSYVGEIKEKLCENYNDILHHAEKSHSTAEHVTRMFLIGNPGAGKSTFVEAMKSEGFFERVPKSSVSLHTADVVPNIYTSEDLGKVLFYDFAGDPEYYSSNAAILENLSLSSGDNIFIIFVNLREDTDDALRYWLSFVQYQRFSRTMMVIGSYFDPLMKEMATERRLTISTILSHHFSFFDINYFTLDCCSPTSQQLEDINDRLVDLTKDSPCYKLSLAANMLLGVLEKDFSNVTLCSAQTILSHIEIIGMDLPKSISLLIPVLKELYDLGYLIIIGDDESDIYIILKVSQVTSEVHRLLFSSEAKMKSIEGEEETASGFIPQSFVKELLPEYITKECLVQFQYCQEISQRDVSTFPTLTQHDSSSQSFLFFPALCTVNKSEVMWASPPNLSYSIGWLAQCADTSCDYFPPRFLHALLLRLVYRFILTQDPIVCTVWKGGIYWSVEEGVECQVELVRGNKGVAVIAKSNKEVQDLCATVFDHTITCVLEAKAEFCHSIKPQYFFLDPQSSNYLDSDNLFSMDAVESVLASNKKEVVPSITGRFNLESIRVPRLRKFTLWNSLFPLDFAHVAQKLKVVVEDLSNFGMYLNLPKHLLDDLEKDYPSNTERRRAELVRAWMSSSPDPPCWWHLMQALKLIKYDNLAEEIEAEHSKSVDFTLHVSARIAK